MSRVASGGLALMALGTLLSSGVRAETVAFEVTVPRCTPPGATVFLRSNRLASDTYLHDAMEPIGPARYRVAVEVVTDRAGFEYKYSNTVCDANACTGIEKDLDYDGSGHELAPRTLAVGQSATDDLVYVWRNAVATFDAGGVRTGVRPTAQLVAFCGPYLSISSTEGAVALSYDSFWGEPVRLEYGPTEALGQALQGAGSHRNHFALEALAPGQRVHYRLLEAGVERARGSFRAPPAPGEPFRLGVLGDVQTYDAETLNSGRQLAARLAAFEPRLVLSVGDLVASTEGDSGWIPPSQGRYNVLFEQIADLVAAAPLNVTMGNHEEDGAYYWDVFDFPTPDAPALDHYWFRAGNAAFIALYTGATDGYDTQAMLDSQTPWLEQTLAALAQDARVRWRVVFLHRGVYQEGTHHDDGWQFYQGGTAQRASWEQLFKDAGVDLVFQGHNHVFSLAEVEGLRFVTLCSGAPVHEINQAWGPQTVYAESACSVGELEVGPALLRFAAQRADGSFIAEGAFSLCRAAADCEALDNPCAGAVRWACEARACAATCVEPGPDAGPGDSGDDAAVDAAQPDTEISDTRISDTAMSDTVMSDTAMSDTAMTDTAMTDTAMTDTAMTDTAIADAAGGDLAARDSSRDAAVKKRQEEGCPGCSAAGASWWWWVLAALGWRRRGRRAT